jgi:hypothetical protein
MIFRKMQDLSNDVAPSLARGRTITMFLLADSLRYGYVFGMNTRVTSLATRGSGSVFLSS